LPRFKNTATPSENRKAFEHIESEEVSKAFRMYKHHAPSGNRQLTTKDYNAGADCGEQQGEPQLFATYSLG
jgi:hypothetical protein